MLNKPHPTQKKHLTHIPVLLLLPPWSMTSDLNRLLVGPDKGASLLLALPPGTLPHTTAWEDKEKGKDGHSYGSA